MSNQQKDKQSSSATGAGGEGLRKQDKDDTGGPRGDALSGAVGAAAAGGDSGKDSILPPAGKGGASKA